MVEGGKKQTSQPLLELWGGPQYFCSSSTSPKVWSMGLPLPGSQIRGM